MTFLNLLTLLVLFGSSSTAILLIVSLTQRYIETKVPAILFLLGTTLFVLISDIVELIFAMANFENLVSNYASTSIFQILFEIMTLNNLVFNYLSVLTIIFETLGLVTAGLFLLFIEYFAKENISVTKMSVYTGSVIGYIIASFFMLSIETITLNPSFRLLLALTQIFVSQVVLFFLLYVIITCLRSIEHVKPFAWDSVQIRQLFFMQLVIIFYYVVPVICVVSIRIFSNIVNLSDDFYLLIYVIIPRTSLLLGSLVLWWVYALSPRVAFLQAQKMYKLYVVTDSGALAYSFDFRKEIKDDISELLSAGLNALKAMIRQAVGASSDVATVKFKEREIIVRTYDHFDLFLITENASNFLHKAMDSFGEAFRNSYDLSDTTILNRTQFKDAEILVKKAFGLD